MNKASVTLVAVMSILLVSMWAVFNKPDQLPVWPATIQGTSFSPFRPGQTPKEPRYPSDKEISRDIRLLAGQVESLRTYTVAGPIGHVPLLAKPYNVKATVGIWLSGDVEENRREIDRFKALFPLYGWNLAGVVVGNESLLRADLTVEELSDYLDEIKAFVGDVPVTTAETWDIWLKAPQLAEHVDYVAVHVLPYWEGVPADIAHQYVFQRYDSIRARYPDKRVILGEVGWPSEGRQRGGSVPSLQNQAKFLRNFLYEAERRDANYFVLEAFDQVWKTDEGAVGRYWGIYDAERQPKFPFRDPVAPVPEWPAIAGFSLGFAILMLAFLLRDSRGLVHRGRGFLVLVSYLISTLVVWLVYDYSSKYLTWEQVFVGIGLLVAAFCVTVVVLAEAHEWAEAIWTRRRTVLPVRANAAASARRAKVSVHIPTYNEPPAMVIETLEALERLRYPEYEVIVVDNNTDDRAVWQPVADWCAAHPERFRFHHVNPLAGYKAGALNYALEHTAPDAEFVAVIDSDYRVEPDWLCDCTVPFEADDVAIVQAPQDYRDDRENAFKAMMAAEYAGFFGIGMVTRNLRNAIIQHGTMTIVRRRVLEAVDGWSEWCITEDAELGLRILAQGGRAVYVPRSYGRGLMPDNFLDYKKQRFRWAYGSVLIMRHHMQMLFGMRRSALSPGQRYHFVAGWLPWMADGLCLLFNLFALGYAVMMIAMPGSFTPPEVMLSLLPIGFFGFKVAKMLMLYRHRMQAGFRQCAAAALSGLAVSHTISRAMLAGLQTSRIGFFRTPKRSRSHSALGALSDAREECLFAIALLMAAFAIAFRDDAYLLDTRMWILLLVVQSIPYVAAVVVSLISSFRTLPASLVTAEGDRALLERLPELDSGKPLVTAPRSTPRRAPLVARALRGTRPVEQAPTRH